MGLADRECIDSRAAPCLLPPLRGGGGERAAEG